MKLYLDHYIICVYDNLISDIGVASHSPSLPLAPILPLSRSPYDYHLENCNFLLPKTLFFLLEKGGRHGISLVLLMRRREHKMTDINDPQTFHRQ